MKVEIKKRFLSVLLVPLFIVVAVTLFSACGSDKIFISYDSTVGLAQESAADYNKNINGLITVTTLKDWLDDWASNKPAGITGLLIILQVNSGKSPREFIKPNGTDIFTYKVDQSEWVEIRSNGLFDTPNMVLSGASMDAFLTKYNINPSKDMIVFAMGEGGNSQNMYAGRGWYMFRYWGTKQEHLAILNGGLDYHTSDLPDSYFTSTPSTPPENGTFSVRSLPDDNTALQAGTGEMLDIVKGNYILPGGVLLWDARSADEFNGMKDKTKGDNSNTYVAFEGTIKGAVNLEYLNLFDPNAGYSYKDKATLKGLVDGLGYQYGKIVYTWCRTGFRGITAFISSNVILGYPTKIYDGSWVEWGRLVYYSSSNLLPSNSLYRADLPDVTDNLTFNTEDTVGIPANIVSNPSTAQKIIEDDKAYKN